jgi:NTP pyrophosphatase (non-canonical NTP hydrolase)
MTSIRELQDICGRAAHDKGFHDDRPRPMRIGSSVTAQRERQEALTNWQGNKLMLIVSEVAEAQDELRKGHAADLTYYVPPALPPTLVAEVGVARAADLIAKENAGKLRKPEGAPSELADVVIRVLDFCYTEGIDLESIITEKLAYNATRAYKHGKKF